MSFFFRIIALKNIRYNNSIAYFLCIVFIIASVFVSVNRYWQYDVFYFDFGIFDQAIWKVSRLQPPIIDHFIVGGKWIFADHFSPSIFLLAPFYWITSRSEMLLVIQAIVVGLSGLVLYKIGVEVLKEKFLPLVILVCYYLFLGLQNAVISDFHELTVMTLPLMLTFWAIVKKKSWLLFFFLFITLGFKESAFLIGIGIGIALIFLRKEWTKIACFTILLSMLWGGVVIKLIIPYFSGGVYAYIPVLPSGISEKILVLVDHPIKRETLFYSFLSFGFLPIFSPEFWFLILQDYLARFLSASCCTRWDLGLHYNAESAVLLGVSSLFALKRLKTNKRLLHYKYFFGIVLMFNALFLFRFVLHGPLGLAYNPAFYKHTQDFYFLDKMVQMVPKEAVVMTHNDLAARFTHQKVWLLREDYQKYKPDYILIDLRKGQNPNDFFTTQNPKKILKKLLIDPSYKIIYQTKEQFIFYRKIK